MVTPPSVLKLDKNYCERKQKVLIIDFRNDSKGNKTIIAWEPKLKEFEVEVQQGDILKKY